MLYPEVAEGLLEEFYDSDPRPRLHVVTEEINNSVPVEWAPKFKDYPFPESKQMMKTRYQESIQHLADKHVNENLIIVSHGYGVMSFNTMHTDLPYNTYVDYTAITAVTNDGGPKNVVTAVDDSHNR